MQKLKKDTFEQLAKWFRVEAGNECLIKFQSGNIC